MLLVNLELVIIRMLSRFCLNRFHYCTCFFVIQVLKLSIALIATVIIKY